MITDVAIEVAAVKAADLPQGLKALLTQSQVNRLVNILRGLDR